MKFNFISFNKISFYFSYLVIYFLRQDFNLYKINKINFIQKVLQQSFRFHCQSSNNKLKMKKLFKHIFFLNIIIFVGFEF